LVWWCVTVPPEAWTSHSLDSSRDEPRGLKALLHKASLPHVRHSVSRLLTARHNRRLDHLREYNHNDNLAAVSSSDSLAPLTANDDDTNLSTSTPTKQV